MARAAILPRQPEAFAAVAEGDLDDAANEGFVLPPWYDLDRQKTARRDIDQASRHGIETRGYLDKKIFRHYLTTRVLPRARVCYDHALARAPTRSGRVVLEMEVGKGEVMLARTQRAELDGDDPKLVACMTEAAWALDIPAGKLDDRIYRVRYPLQLVPPPTGKTGGQVVRIPDEMMEVLLAHQPG